MKKTTGKNESDEDDLDNEKKDLNVVDKKEIHKNKKQAKINKKKKNDDDEDEVNNKDNNVETKKEIPNYKPEDFKKPSNGKEYNLKMVTFNVNGIRACIEVILILSSLII